MLLSQGNLDEEKAIKECEDQVAAQKKSKSSLVHRKKPQSIPSTAPYETSTIKVRVKYNESSSAHSVNTSTTTLAAFMNSLIQKFHPNDHEQMKTKGVFKLTYEDPDFQEWLELFEWEPVIGNTILTMQLKYQLNVLDLDRDGIAWV